MSEVKNKTTETKQRARKNTKKEAEAVMNPMEEMIKSMTPEMMNQFMMFIESQSKKDTLNTKQEEKQKITKSYLSKIRDREVVVRSVSVGTVGYESKKTNIYYTWSNYGDIETLTVGEILEMDGRSKLFLHTPWLVIEDDEVNEALGLIKHKEVVGVFDDFESFLELPTKEMKEYLSKVEKGYVCNICGKVQQAIDDGILTDFRKIRELEKMMKAEFKY